ncbi:MULTISPECIES: DUF3060 domain-containing protein [Mycobacterium]|uniref:DUF3060 domain-containing protein n=1 Tax=Mycobacterium colombiense TaxID=339268 RepID=A0A329L896_9MYCO|nr:MULTISPECIES: DUF3060 domain-containing protein [Mycobacterium]MDM4143132.1 DUF3060 domain-containing protein [Mycobacterium sp. FLAC0960]RAV04235.1 hypothetical protein DQP57_24745 [Mycobacterium colombiense]
MAANEDPEDRIRELERPLAEAARASEQGSAQPAGQNYAPGPAGAPPPPPAPWTYGGPPFVPPQQRPSANRAWWILGTIVAIGVLALAGGIAAFAAHRLSGVKSIIATPPTISTTVGPPSVSMSPGPSTSRRKSASPSTSPAAPPGTELSVSGINENRTIACNDNIVSVSGVSNTVSITGHCASLSVSGVQNSITVEAVDSIEASGFNNKVTYHSGAPKISNSGGSNVVGQG